MNDSLSNASLGMEKRIFAGWKTDRYVVERTIQDATTEAGWDDRSSSKYRADMQTLAIDATHCSKACRACDPIWSCHRHPGRQYDSRSSRTGRLVD